MGRASPTVLVVDLNRRRQEALDQALDDCDVVHVDTAAKALEVIDQADIDVVVTAQDLPEEATGLGLIRRVAKMNPDALPVLAAEHLDVETAVEIANQGVFRLLHAPTVPELVEAVEETVAAVDPSPSHPHDQALDVLSPREREVVDLIADGFRVSQVAERLFISPHTVRNHLKRAFPKLGVHSQAELIGRFGRSVDDR